MNEASIKVWLTGGTSIEVSNVSNETARQFLVRARSKKTRTMSITDSGSERMLFLNQVKIIEVT